MMSSESGWDRETELMWAAAIGKISDIERLLVGPRDVDAGNAMGETALMKAAAGGHLGAVELLIGAGCDIEARSKTGLRAAMAAAYCGSSKCLEKLLSSGCDVDARDAEGASALVFALRRCADSYGDGALASISLLLSAGCGLDGVDDRGHSAEELAEAMGLKTAIELIRAEREKRTLSKIVGGAGSAAPVGARRV